jgi:hypothetical protein
MPPESFPLFGGIDPTALNDQKPYEV